MCEHTLLLLTQQLLLMLLCNNEQQVSPVPDHLGRGHHITIVRDSTAVKKMESAKAYAEREALANKVKTETMQALSHDLRTPLQVHISSKTHLLTTGYKATALLITHYLELHSTTLSIHAM